MALSKDEFGDSDQSTLKLAVPQERINGIKWFGTCWYKLKKLKATLVIGGSDQKCIWPLRSCNSKIRCVSRMIWWIVLDFCMLIVVQ